MPDIAKTSGAINVLTSSTVVAGNNPGRTAITCTNDGANDIWLTLATTRNNAPGGQPTPVAPTAVANSGYLLEPGGSFTSTRNGIDYTGPIAGIAITGTTVLAVTEI